MLHSLEQKIIETFISHYDLITIYYRQIISYIQKYCKIHEIIYIDGERQGEMDYKYVWNIIHRQHVHEIKMIIRVLNINNLISGLSFLVLSIWCHNQKLSRYDRRSYVIPWPSASKWQNFILSLSLHNLDDTCIFFQRQNYLNHSAPLSFYYFSLSYQPAILDALSLLWDLLCLPI